MPYPERLIVPRQFQPREGFVMENHTRRNIATKSENLSDAAWTKTRATVATSAQVAPDPTKTMYTVNEDGTAANTHAISISATYTQGLKYAISFYAKQANRPAIGINMAAFAAAGGTPLMGFDLSNGTAGFTNSTWDGIAHSRNIRLVRDGIYRVELAFTYGNTTGARSFFILAGTADDAVADWTFNGLSQPSFYLWGFQIEQAPSVGPYLPRL